MDQPTQSVVLDVSLHGDPVEGVIRFASRPDQRFTGYLELIQVLETERCAVTASGPEG
jgi:hypothetical protein